MNASCSPWLASLGALALVGAAVSLDGGRAHAQTYSPPLLADATDAPAPFAAVLHAIPLATVVRIHDGWMGLSALAPIDHRYEFRRVGAEYRGHGVCRVAHQEHALADVAFPASTVTALLARLATVSLTGGPYRPLITHTDDYPSASIEIETPAGTLTFASRSQGRFIPPWQLTLASGATGVVSATVPGEVITAFLARIRGEQCGEWVRTLPRH